MLNTSKTQFVHFSPQTPNHKVSFQFDGVTITAAPSTKFLGLHVDQSLRWSEHVNAVNNKLNSAYFAISRIRDNMPICALINVYYSLVYSHLCYNIILWGNSIDSNKLFITQKKIIRKMLRLKFKEPCKSHFIKNKILPYHCIYIYYCLVYVRENISKFQKNALSHDYSTRNSNLLRVPIHNTSKIEKSFRYMGLKLYNKLPPSYKENSSNTSFKKQVKMLLEHKCYYSVQEYLEDAI